MRSYFSNLILFCEEKTKGECIEMIKIAPEEVGLFEWQPGQNGSIGGLFFLFVIMRSYFSNLILFCEEKWRCFRMNAEFQGCYFLQELKLSALL